MFSRIEQVEGFTVVGVEVTTRYDQAEKVGPAVGEFIQRSGEVKHAVSQDEYGVALRDGKEDFTYLYGYKVSAVEDVPAGMVAREVPAQEYAVLVHKGPVEKIGGTYTYFYQTWLPGNGYERPAMPFFEVYGEKFIPAGEHVADSVMEIYLPIVKKAETVAAE